MDGLAEFLLLLCALRLVKEWLKSQFEVQSHGAESRPLEKEVKVLVIVPLTLLRSLRVGATDLRCLGDLLLCFHGLLGLFADFCRFFDSLAFR